MSSYTINSYNSCTQNSTNFRLQVNNATNYHKSYRKGLMLRTGIINTFNDFGCLAFFEVASICRQLVVKSTQTFQLIAEE